MANADIGIGKLIDQERGKDAIHVAVAPVEAAYPLIVGSHVCILPDGKAGYGTGSIGIVDPFLMVAPKAGDLFYLFLYPGSITSLRHEWVHPAFERKPEPEAPKNASRQWIEGFADRIGTSYEYLMKGADAYVADGSYLNMGSNETYGDYYHEMPTFWNHYSALTGKVVNETGSFFSCAC